MPKYLSNLLKLLITVVGVYLVLQNVTIADIVATLTEVKWFWVLLAVGLMTASLVLRAYRWQLLLFGVNSHITLGRLTTIYFIGNFFNAFLPSGFGGDVVRVVEAARDVPTDIAAGTVLVDRLTGLLTLFVMGLIGLPFRPADFPVAQTWMVLSLSVGGLIGGYLLLDGRLIQRWGGWLPGKLSPVGDGPLAKLLKAIQACGWRAVWGALGVSALFNLLLVAWWAACGRALNLDISYGYYLLVIPILSVAMLVPSVGGLGVRENMTPLLFAPAGVSFHAAVTLAILTFLVLRLTSLFGAPVYLWSHPPRQKIIF
ncbi:MAG: lysylphosphatidylglycerol synthase transmembrane domain-containing protein [Candidatus Promineifilaceae bacterium]